MSARLSQPLRRVILRLGVTLVLLALWFWTQSLIGARTLTSGGISDGLHQLTAPLNAYFNESPRATNALLIVSSALIDALALSILGYWLAGRSVRPFLGLVLLLGLRQLLQAICLLPVPPRMIWHYPGFPSLLVTYRVANDFFFSGHTAIAVFGATQIARLGQFWLTALAVCLVVLEISTVIVLRVHYTMDVFTGIVAALWVAYLCERVSPRLDHLLGREL